MFRLYTRYLGHGSFLSKIASKDGQMTFRIERFLPLCNRSYLAGDDLAWRIYCASQGLIGQIMELVRAATRKALARGDESITQDLLSAAFKERLAGERRGIKNPFDGSTPLSCEPLPLSSR